MVYNQENQRYQRQISLKGFGEAGQEKLHKAKVLVVGAGGLGCPALQYLAGAGVGTLGIVDHDIISLDNLHRQVLYSTDDVGLSKALRAAAILESLNPEIDIVPYNEALTTSNALGILSHYDIILDGTDNFATRYMVNDACVLTGKTLVYGAISRFEGQLAVFNQLSQSEKTNYRDLFPDPPSEHEILNCEEAGVIGVLPGIIGTMMAGEAIKLITGIGEALINRLITYNSLNNQFYELQIVPRKETSSLIPLTTEEFIKRDYDWLCADRSVGQIDIPFFEHLLNNPNVSFIDVREPYETPIIDEFEHLNIPLASLSGNISNIECESIVLFCQTGKRSLTAARIFSEHFGSSKKIYSLMGGIARWKSEKV